jgi:phage recombination protein Bet
MSQNNDVLVRQEGNGEHGLQLATEYGFKRAEIEEIKRTIARGASDIELAVFLRTASRLGLDPFARQIFLIERYQGGGKVMTPQVSIDGFRLVAETSGQYMPGPRPTFTYDGDREPRQLVSAIAYVKKQDASGAWHVIDCEAFYDEYVQRTRDGNVNAMWRKMPRVMLAKCAEALALRKAFPNKLSGVYTPDELPAETPETGEQTAPRGVKRTKQQPQHTQAAPPAQNDAPNVLDFAGEASEAIDADFEDVSDEEAEAAAIREENAQGTAAGATPALDEQIGEEFARLVGVMTECHSIAPRGEKSKYRPLGTLKNYVNLKHRVSDGLDSLDATQKAQLLADLNTHRKQAAKSLNEFLQAINEQ